MQFIDGYKELIDPGSYGFHIIPIGSEFMEITQVQNKQKMHQVSMLVGFSPTPLKNMLVKMGPSSPGGESKKSLKPPVMTQV